MLYSLMPPFESVGLNVLPVVCRESPVLSSWVKVVWNGTSLGVEIENRRIGPSLRTVSAHSNRHVPHNGDSFFGSMFCCTFQLCVEMVLYEKYVSGIFTITQFLSLPIVIYSIFTPIGKACSPVSLTKQAEGCIWQKPCLVVGDESPEIVVFVKLILYFLIFYAHILVLDSFHCLIVGIVERVEFSPPSGERGHQSFVFQFSHLFEVKILWM